MVRASALQVMFLVAYVFCITGHHLFKDCVAHGEGPGFTSMAHSFLTM